MLVSVSLASRVKMLAIAEYVGKAGAGAVVAARKALGGLIVPVAIERKIPGELAPKFDVVGGVEVRMQPTRVGKGWEYGRGDVEICFIKAEELQLPDDQG